MIEGNQAVAIAGTLAGAVSFCAAVYGWGKWLARPRPPEPSRDQDARLQRIEAAIETMAVEVERIGEGQRFTTKLLAERGRVAPPMGQGALPYRPAVTPH
jgi:hypothetical protein